MMGFFYNNDFGSARVIGLWILYIGFPSGLGFCMLDFKALKDGRTPRR